MDSFDLAYRQTSQSVDPTAVSISIIHPEHIN